MAIVRGTSGARRGTLTVLGALLALGVACAPAPPPAAPPPPPLVVGVSDAGPPASTDAALVADARRPASGSSPFEAALRDWSVATQCASHDYFPNGGIQSFWCHRPSRVTLAWIKEVAGHRIFASGPHTADALVLDSADSFGHYDPAFVRWLVDTASPSPRGSFAQEATQASYDRSLKPLATVFWRTLEKARGDSACFAREKAAYAALVQKRALPRGYAERWFYFMNPYFCDAAPKPSSFYFDNGTDFGSNGNVVKSVVGFWIRRSLDGTMETFAEGLKKLVASYDPALLDAAPPIDGKALTQTVDACVKAASVCKDPTAKMANAVTYVSIAPSGQVTAELAYMGFRGKPVAACVTSACAHLTGPTLALTGPVRFARTIPVR